MAESLHGRVVVVVGASSGMGRATAERLVREGASVMAAARREERLRELQQELSDVDGTLEICAADVTDAAAVERLIDTTLQRFGKIDVLVYATGTNIPDRSLQVLTLETWQMMLDTNLTGAFRCTRAVLPAMRENGGGLIIYLSSTAVQFADVSGVAYQSSKHGLSGLARGTQVEERANGIRTTVLFPGLCDTEILTKRPQPTPREIVELALDPEDVADAVLFVTRLHPRAVVPELQMLPSRL